MKGVRKSFVLFCNLGGRCKSKTISKSRTLKKVFNFFKKEIWIIGPHPRVSVSGGLEWVLRICILTKFSGDEDAAAPFEDPCIVVQLLLPQAYHTLKTTAHSFIHHGPSIYQAFGLTKLSVIAAIAPFSNYLWRKGCFL